MPDFLSTFDAEDGRAVCARRTQTVTAPQALFMMNNPFVLEQSRHAAKRLLAERHADDRVRLARAWRLVLGRVPTDGEAAVALRHVGSTPQAEQGWASVFHALFASPEFRYVN